MANSKYICIARCTYPIVLGNGAVRHKLFKIDEILFVPDGQEVPKHFRPINKQAKVDRKAQIAKAEKLAAEKVATEGTVEEQLTAAQAELAKLKRIMAGTKPPDVEYEDTDLDDLDEDDDEDGEDLPDLSWSKARLLAYAEEELDMDIPDRTNKNDILELINAELEDLEEE